MDSLQLFPLLPVVRKPFHQRLHIRPRRAGEDGAGAAEEEAGLWAVGDEPVYLALEVGWGVPTGSEVVTETLFTPRALLPALRSE